MVAVKDADFSTVDAVFCCLPHGTTQVPFDLLRFYYFCTIHAFEILLSFAFSLPLSYIWTVDSWFFVCIR